MIGALNRLAEWAAFFLAQPRAAVAADIVEGPHFASRIPQNDQAFARHFLDKIITRFRDLTLMPDAQPLDRENMLLLLREDFLRNEITLRQRSVTSGEGFRGFPKNVHCFRFHFLVRGG